MEKPEHRALIDHLVTTLLYEEARATGQLHRLEQEAAEMIEDLEPNEVYEVLGWIQLRKPRRGATMLYTPVDILKAFQHLKQVQTEGTDADYKDVDDILKELGLGTPVKQEGENQKT